MPIGIERGKKMKQRLLKNLFDYAFFGSGVLSLIYAYVCVQESNIAGVIFGMGIFLFDAYMIKK